MLLLAGLALPSQASPLWDVSTFVGSFDALFQVVVDTSGRVFAVGNDGTNLDVIGYSSSGVVLSTWTTNGGGASASGYGLALDTQGYVYAAGSRYNGSNNDFLFAKFSSTGGASLRGTYDAGGGEVGSGIGVSRNGPIYVGGTKDYLSLLLVQYGVDGAVSWTRTNNSGGLAAANALAMDATGYVYLTGYSTGASDDVRTLKYDGMGNLVWDSTYSTAGMERGNGIAAAASGNVYVTGYQGTSTLLLKYDAAGALQWSRTWSGATASAGNAVTVDAEGSVLVAGYSAESGGGNNDFRVWRFDSAGNLLETRLYSDPGVNSEGRGIAAGSGGTFYVSGLGGGSKFRTLADVFVDSLSSASFSAVSSTAATASWTSTYPSGTLYYAQLSTMPGFVPLAGSSATLNAFAQFSGLAANTIYYAQVSTSPAGLFTQLGSTATPAAPPSGSSLISVTTTTVRFQWNLNGNPPDTQFQAGIWTMPTFVPVSLGPWTTGSTTVTISGLSPYTTYYVQVRARGRDGTPTAYDVGLSTRTDPRVIELAYVWGTRSDGYGPSAAAWGDYDNDGLPDIAVAADARFGYSNRVFHNNGDGTFTQVWASTQTETTAAVAWGDYDNDGRLDLAFCNNYPGTPAQPNVRVYHNDGGGNFSLVWVSTETDNCHELHWGDYDNDGRVDLLAVNDDVFTPSRTRVYRNLGNGRFASVWSSPDHGFFSGAWGDYDQDGRLDILLGARGSPAQYTRVYRNIGGTFVLAWSSTETSIGTSVGWVDADGDGRPDFLALDGGNSYQLRTYRYDGSTFTFTAATAVSLDDNLAAADLDGDGFPDVVTQRRGSGGQGANNAYRNDGTGRFSFNPVWSSTHGFTGGTVDLADYDGDGRPDLLVADGAAWPNNPTLRVYRNVSAGSGTPPSAPAAGFSTSYTTATQVLSLRWGAGSDVKTSSAALLYAVRAGTSPGGTGILSDALPPASASRQHPQFVAPGILGMDLSVALAGGASVYWSVRSVNAAGMRGSASPQQFLIVPAAAPSTAPVAAAFTSPMRTLVLASTSPANTSIVVATATALDVSLLDASGNVTSSSWAFHSVLINSQDSATMRCGSDPTQPVVDGSNWALCGPSDSPFAVTIAPGQTRGRFYVWDTAIGTKTLQASVVRQDGFTLPLATQTVVIGGPAICAITRTVKQAGGGDCTDVQSCLNLVPSSLTSDFCVDIEDDASYTEFAVVNINTNGHRLYVGSIEGAHHPSFHSDIANAGAVIKVQASSVTLMHVSLAPPINNEGIAVSSPNALIQDVFVSYAGGGSQNDAAIDVSSWTTVLRTSVTAASSSGLHAYSAFKVTGVGSSISQSTGVGSGSDIVQVVWMYDTSSNTITSSYFANATCKAVAIGSDGGGPPVSDYNTVSLSTMTGTGAGCPALHLAGGGYNTFDSDYIQGSSGTGALFDTIAGANAGNTVSRSTVVSVGGSAGVSLTSAGGFTLIDSWVQAPSGVALDVSGGDFVLERSTLTASGAAISAASTPGLGQTDTVDRCYVRGSTAAAITSSGGLLFSSSTLIASASADPALSLAGSSATVANSVLSGPLWWNGGTSVTLSTVTFQGLAPGATAVALTANATYVATFTAVAFADTNIAVNVDAHLVDPAFTGSRLTMRNASGPRAGSAYADDPGHVVTWLPDPPPQAVSSGPFSGVSAGGLTASWATTYPAGTSYYVQLSTLPGFIPLAASTLTASTSAAIGGLLGNTTYYAQVSASPGGPFTSLGSTTTPIESPTAVVFDAVSTTSLVAAAYAPTPAFTNLGQGQSGTNIAIGGVYAGWHGSTWTSRAPLPTARYEMASAALGGRIYCVGGWNGSATTANESYDPVSNTWASRAAMPTARTYASGGAASGKLFVMGGYNGTSYLTTNEQYDPVADTWAARSPLPLAHQAPAAANVNGQIYLIGGYNGSFLSANESYDPAADLWTTHAPMPTARHSLAVAAAGGAIYAMGGDTGASFQTKNEAYHPATDSWSTQSPMLSPRANVAAATLGGKIYLLGGYNNATNLAIDEEYDPTADTWAARPPLSVARRTLTAVALGGRLYAIGGNNGSFLSTNESFDPGTAQVFTGLAPNSAYPFTAKARNAAGVETATINASTYTLAVATPLPTGAAAFTNVLANGLTVNWASGTATGGFNGPGATFLLQASTNAGFVPVIASVVSPGASSSIGGLLANTMHYFRVQAYNALGGTDYSWTVLGSTVTGIETPTAVVFDAVSTTSLVAAAYARTPAFTNLGQGLSGTNIAVGGAFASWHASTWTSHAAMITPRQATAGGVLNGLLYVIGGGVTGPTAFNEAYNPVTDAWAAKASLPTPRHSLAAGVIAGKLHLVGGTAAVGKSAAHEVYDPVADAWTTAAPLSQPRSDLAAAVVNGKLYAVGGVLNSGVTALNETYDASTDSWTTKSPLPSARYSLAAAAYNGKVYAFGGYNAPGANTQYDPVGDVWTAKAPIPTPRTGEGADVLGGKIYVFGGIVNGSTPTAAAEAYDAAADSWTTLPPMLTARGNFTVGVIAGRFHVAGGVAAGAQGANEAFDPGTAQSFTGLTPNTLCAFSAKARNANGVETGIISASTYTLAIADLPPAGTPTFSNALANSLTVNWASGTATGGFNGPGATFLLQASTNASFVPVIASVVSPGASSSIEGLLANTTHYFRVQAYNAVGGTDYSWTVLGSTVTGIETPTAVVFDAVSTTSLVAAAYAPTPALTNLGQGLSGTNIALGGVFAGWHGESWAARAPLSSARYALAAAAATGKVFALGGYSAAPLSTNEAYDPAADAWAVKTPLPVGNDNLNAVAMGGAIYAVGGESLGGIVNTNQRYDPALDAWSARSPLPSARTGEGLTVLNGSIFSLGGFTVGGNLPDVVAYDPNADTWSGRASLPMGTQAMAGAAVRGRIYAVGGSAGVTISTNSRYDPALDTWAPDAPLPTAANYPAYAVIGAKLYLFGGGSAAGGQLASTQEFDPVSDVWTLRGPMPTARARASAAVVAGRAYVLGGLNGGAVAANEMFDPGTAQWFSGLTPNTLYSFTAKARNANGVETGTVSASTYTLAFASVPAGVAPVFPGVFITSVTVAWSSGSAAGGFNGPGATYLVQASTLSGSSPVFASAVFAAAPAALTGLLPTTTYYFRLRALNAAGAPNDWVALGSTLTASGPATRLWTGGGLTTNATEGANWLGGVAPRAGDSVWFDAVSSKTCLWDDAVPIASFTLSGGYAGIVSFTTSSTMTAVEVAGGALQVPANSTTTISGSLRVDGNASVSWASGRLRLLGDLAIASPLCCSWVSSGAGSILELGGSQYQVMAGTGRVELPHVEVNSSSAVLWGFTGSSLIQAQAIAISSGLLQLGGNGVLHTSAWSQTAGSFDPGTGTVTFRLIPPDLAATARTLPGQPFRNLEVGSLSANPATLTALSPLAMSGTFTVSSGAFLAGAFTHTVGGDWQEAGGPSLFAPGGRLRLAGTGPQSVRFSPFSTLQAVEAVSPSTTSFQASFSAAAVSATAAGTPLVFAAGATITVSSLTLGSPGLSPRLTARSSIPGSAWYLVVTGTSAVTRSDAGDSDASGGLTVAAADGTSVDSGGNRNWDFGSPPPAAPSAPVGTVLGVSSVSWAWTAVPRAEFYKVYTAAGGLLARPTTTSFLQTSLTPNATVQLAVAAVAEGKTGALSSTGAAHTLAQPPTGLAASQVAATSATLSWSLNGNPPATTAELQRSTDALAFADVFLGAATSFVDQGLVGCTTFYYRVRDRNIDGVDTAFAAAAPFLTPATTPAPPGDFAAVSLDGARVRLSWTPSPTEGIVGYRLYYGTAAVDYSSPLAVLPPTATSTTTAALQSGVVYRFGLRAVHRCGLEEPNTSVVASAAALASASGVRAAIKVPSTGKHIAGNRVLVMAELTSGDPAQTGQVLFQARPSSAAAWGDLPAALAEHPNPDRDFPYFVQWDVTSVSSGSYDLRAVATDVFGSSDPLPGFITVVVDPVNPEVSVTDLGGGSQQTKQVVNSGAKNTVSAAETTTGLVTQVQLPAGALSASTATLTVTVNPAGAPAAAPGAATVGGALQVELSNGQTQLAGGQTAALVFTYPDTNGDGVVDGTSLRADQLEVRSYDPVSATWRKESASVVDTQARTVTAATPHFSFFQVFGTVASDLSGIRVYPNPFKPNGGNPDEGHAYSPGDPVSGIIFDNLPKSVQIKVYTVTGKLVASFGTDNGTGTLQWDARNSDGKDVATGGYFAVITSPGQSQVVRKLGVIR